MKNFQLIQNLQEDIGELKSIANYKHHGLNQEQSMLHVQGITKNLEDHLEDLIKAIY